MSLDLRSDDCLLQRGARPDGRSSGQLHRPGGGKALRRDGLVHSEVLFSCPPARPSRWPVAVTAITWTCRHDYARVVSNMTKTGDRLVFDFTGSDPQIEPYIRSTARNGPPLAASLRAAVSVLCYDITWTKA